MSDPRAMPGCDARPGRIRRGDWICVGLLAVVTLGIFWQGIFDRVGMIHEDAAYQYHPFYQFAADEVRDGRFPHWNPYATCGVPFHASMMGAVLYPLRWPLFWLSWPVAYALSLGVHFFLTGLFMFVFIRTVLGCSPIPALVGAISLAFGGFTLGHLSHPNYFQAYPWFVLTVLLLAQSIQRQRWTWAVAAAIPVGLMGLIGAVHLLLILSFGLAVWAGAEAVIGLVARMRGREATVASAFRPAAAVAIALALGGAMAMAQFYPALLQTELSVRADTGWEFVTELSAHPRRTALLLVAPFYWGNYRLGYWGDDYFHDPCLYAGIVPLVLAAVAIAVCPRDRWVLRLVGLCVIVFLVAAGKYLPFYWVLYKCVPMFDKLRCPGRLLLWLQFGLACLAAIGLQKILLGLEPGLRKRAIIAAVFIGALVLVGTGVCLVRLNRQAVDPSGAQEHIRQLKGLLSRELDRREAAAEQIPRRVMREFDPVTWLGIAAAVASSVICGALTILRIRRVTLVGSILVGLLVADLALFSGGMVNYSNMDRVVLDRPEHVRFLQDRLGHMRYLCARTPDETEPLHKRSRDAETALHRGALFRIRHAIGGGVGILHTPRQEQLNAELWKASFRMLNLASARYLVANGEIKAGPIRPVFRGEGCFVCQNSRALPRAFMARHVRVFEDPNDVLTEIVMGKSNLSDVAFVEEPIDPLPANPPKRTWRSGVVQLETEPGWFRIRTRSPIPGQLVVTEAYHPQWQCLIGDQPADICLTDWTFMSVRVPAGEHTITMWFEPTRFKRGLVITVAATLLVIGALVAPWVIRRRAAPSQAGRSRRERSKRV